MRYAVRLLTLASLTLWLGGLLFATEARAITFLENAGAAGSRHPFTARVMPVGPVNAYFNPCLLLESPSSVLFAPMGYFENLKISYQGRPAGADLSSGFAGSSGALPTSELPRTRGSHDTSRWSLYLGQANATQIIPGRFALGFYLLLSGSSFGGHDSFFVDEREQFFSNSLHFELFEERMKTVSFAFALAGKPVDWLSLGGGIHLGFTSRAETSLYLADDAASDATQINTRSQLDLMFAPHFSASFEPIEGLYLTTTLHLAYASDNRGKASSLARGDDAGESLVTTNGTWGYLPIRGSLGVSYGREESEDLSWTVAATALWGHWSTYEDRQGDHPKPGFHDTVSVALGADLVYGMHAVGLDLAYVPSPVPDQKGRSNYVDNDRLGVAAGYDVTFDLGKVQIVAGLQAQFQVLIPRSVTKSENVGDPVVDEDPDTAGLQTNNPGWPGYESSGFLLGVGGTLRLQF